MWNWYEWNSQEDFNTWHNAIRIKLDYPLAGYIQLTGELDPTAPLTTEYTAVKLVDGKWIGTVEDEQAEGLTPTDLRPPKRAVEHFTPSLPE
jgi:hypothetical protein